MKFSIFINISNNMFLSSLIYIHLFFFFLSTFFIGISSLSKYSKLKSLSYGILIINMFISLISYFNFEIIKFEKKKIYSFDEIQRITKDQMLSGAVEGGDHLMKTIKNGISTGSFTVSQLAQLILNFNPSHKTANKIIDLGKAGSTAANKKLMIEAWNGVWNEYKKDNNGFIKKIADSGQLWEVNSYMQSWASLRQGDPLSIAYAKDPAIYNLQQLKRADDALLQIRVQNYDKIRAKFEKDLNFIVSKVKAKDPETYKNVTPEKIDQAVDLMINRYVLDGKGHTEEFNKIADQVDRQIGIILGFKIAKTTNRPVGAKWYNYVFPLTNVGRVFGDGRETVHETASWVRDVFDQSFDELTNMDPGKGGLILYSSDIIKSDVGNHYEFKSNRKRELKIEKTNSQLLYFYMGSALLGLLSIVGLCFEYYQVKIRTYLALLILLVSITIIVSLTIAVVNKTFPM